MYRGYARAGRPAGPPESAVTSSEIQNHENGVYKTCKSTGKCFSPDSFVVSKASSYHDLDHLDVLYRGITSTFNFIGMM